ncbi:rab effector MyRIP-like [Argonauta hians]
MKARDNASSAYTELTDEERDKILQVIQRDFTLRENEKKRLEEIEKGVTSEEQNKKLLVEKKNFSENFCPLCCSAFGYIFNRRQICLLCKSSICKSCSQYSYFYSRYICLTCIKKNELRSMSFEWFYSKVGRRFRSFGSAKVVRVLYKKKTALKRHISDGELDHVPVSSPDPNSLPPFNQLRSGDLENPVLMSRFRISSKVQSMIPKGPWLNLGSSASRNAAPNQRLFYSQAIPLRGIKVVLAVTSHFGISIWVVSNFWNSLLTAN